MLKVRCRCGTAVTRRASFLLGVRAGDDPFVVLETSPLTMEQPCWHARRSIGADDLVNCLVTFAPGAGWLRSGQSFLVV